MWGPQKSLKLLFSDWLLPTHMHTHSICTLLALRRARRREGEGVRGYKGERRDNLRSSGGLEQKQLPSHQSNQSPSAGAQGKTLSFILHFEEANILLSLKLLLLCSLPQDMNNYNNTSASLDTTMNHTQELLM